MTSVLHVENDPSWQEFFSDIATERGFDLRQFDNLRAALQAIASERPDIVITDLHLDKDIAIRPSRVPRDRSGYTIAQAARDARVPHVLIASNTIDPSREVPGVPILRKEEAMDWLLKFGRDR